MDVIKQPSRSFLDVFSHIFRRFVWLFRLKSVVFGCQKLLKSVNCHAGYPYLPDEAYLKDCFDNKIKEILCKNWFINRYLEVDRKK